MNQEKLRLETLIHGFSPHAHSHDIREGIFLSNYVWFGQNQIVVIFSGFIKNSSSFWKFKRYNPEDNYDEYVHNRGFCIQFRLDGPQRLSSFHSIHVFDNAQPGLISSHHLISTKNISISGDLILSGGRSISAFGIQNSLFSNKWTHNFSNDYGAVAPVMGRDTLLTVAFSTEWLPFNQFKNPNPSFANAKLLSIKPEDGTVLQTFDIPLRDEYRSPPYSNIMIGDVFYLDCGWHVTAVNSASGAVIWESQPLTRKNELKPLFMYSSSIIPAADTLLYCLDTKLMALDRITGELLWEYALPEMPDEYYIGSEMRIVTLDHVVIIAGLHEIHGVHAQSGEKIWVYSAPDPKQTIFSSPPIRYASNILIGRCDLGVDSVRYAISGITPSTGTEAYRESIDFRLSGNPVIAGSTLYCWSNGLLLKVPLSL